MGERAAHAAGGSSRKSSGASPVATGKTKHALGPRRRRIAKQELESERSFLLALSDALRPLSDAVEIQGVACRILAEHLDVDRAYYVQIDEAAGVARVEHDFARGGAPSLVGEHRIADFAWSVKILRRGEPHIVANTQSSPLVPKADRQACLALQIIACTGAPLIKGGRLVGALCVTASDVRHWTSEEVAMVQEVADRLWSTIERAHTEEALRQRWVQLENQTEQLRSLASDLIRAEQDGREAFGKTLHDHLQQLLFITSMSLHGAGKNHPGDAFLKKARAQLDEAIDAVRSLSLDTAPPVLRRERLPRALQWLGDWAAEKHALKVTVEADESADPEASDIRILLFESVRELLFNVAKHAHAREVVVRAHLSADGMVQVSVTDDGDGFDPQLAVRDARHVRSVGLYSMRERLTVLGGAMQIESAPRRGTCITLSAPRGIQAPNGNDETHGPRTAPPALSPQKAATSTMGERLKILLVDDHALVREGLRQLISSRPQLEVIGEAVDGEDGIRQAHSLRPDVVVMDVSMPVLDGVGATKRLTAELPHIHVYGLSMRECGPVHPIEAAGAVAYFSKRDCASKLVERLLAEHASRQTTQSRRTRGKKTKAKRRSRAQRRKPTESGPMRRA